MRARKRWIIVAMALVLLVCGAFLADHFLKQRHHPGLARFTRQLVTNYPGSFAVEPPLLSITLGEQEMETLRETVEAARERGVILPDGRPYVNGEMEHAGQRSKVRLRIKGKMTDHVKGRKWSFRVVARKDGGFLGMRRFSLQHPGTRNYLVEWLHHRLMAGEGIVALRYGFIRLKLNEEDLGIYAYEEHFGPELLENNGRVVGPLFRFDPGLFWEHRLNEMQGLRFDEPYAAYQAASIDAFGTNDLAKDATARAYFEEAVSLMEAFRRGGLKASQVFEIDLLARRHALIDLMGGHRSMDWSDVKFYYDPVAQRIEPVAYEIFGGERIHTLAGSGRYEGRFRASFDLHDAYFNDDDLFRAYVAHLERVSRPTYLDSALAVLKPALDTAAATVYREFPWKELDVSVLRHNQRIIRRLLDVPKGFHAHLQVIADDTMEVMVVPVEALPIEVHGLRLPDGTLMPPVGHAVVPCRNPGRTGQPRAMRFPIPEGSGLSKDLSLRLEYSVLGASVRRELEIFAHALLEDLPMRSAHLIDAPDMRTHPFVSVDEKAGTIHLRSGSWRLDRDLVIPAGFTVHGTAPMVIDLVAGARIISRSPIALTGLPELPVTIGSSDKSGGGLIVMDAEGTSQWRHVVTTGFGSTLRKGEAGLLFQNSRVLFTECTLQEVPERDLLALVRGSAELKDVLLVGGRDQISIAYANVRMDGVEALGAGDDAMVVRGGHVQVTRSHVEGSAGDGVKVDTHGELRGMDLTILSDGPGMRLAKGALVDLEGLRVETPAVAISLEKMHGRYGPSRVNLRGADLRGGEGEVADAGGNQVRSVPLDAVGQ